jgi:hypothetical protein
MNRSARLPASSSPCAKRMGRGTMCNMVEGPTTPDRPSTALRAVPLPIASGDRED